MIIKQFPISLVTFLTPLTLGISLLGVSSVQAESNNQKVEPSNQAPSEQETDVDPEKASLIKEYIEVSNEKEMVIESITIGLEENPQIPNDIVEEYVNRFEADYVDLVTPIYAEHFTTEQLEALIEFYQSDVGQSIAEQTPEAYRDAYERTFNWGQKTMQEIMEERRNQPMPEVPDNQNQDDQMSE